MIFRVSAGILGALAAAALLDFVLRQTTQLPSNLAVADTVEGLMLAPIVLVAGFALSYWLTGKVQGTRTKPN